jgi:hypothetical protein
MCIEYLPIALQMQQIVAIYALQLLKKTGWYVYLSTEPLVFDLIYVTCENISETLI